MTTDLPVNKVDLPDLIEMLVQNEKRIAGNGYFGTVYRCPCKQYGEVSNSYSQLARAIPFHCL